MIQRMKKKNQKGNMMEKLKKMMMNKKKLFKKIRQL